MQYIQFGRNTDISVFASTIKQKNRNQQVGHHFFQNQREAESYITEVNIQGKQA